MSKDKQWASKYLLDPLTAPQPADEDGPGNRFVPASETPEPSDADVLSGKNSRYHVSQVDLLTGDPAPLPRRGKSERIPPSHRDSSNGVRPSHHSGRSAGGSGVPPSGTAQPGRRRGSSLTERYPGDRSHHPLDIIKRETKAANRSPHLRKKHQPGKDSIDGLDNIGPAYHHEGPYEATLLARNTSHKDSPIEALRDSNKEALKATPTRHVNDSLAKHRPLDGTAVYVPGSRDEYGNRLDYEEGSDLMHEEPGNYKRWPGMKYHPDDLKGKGEPSYSVERGLKEHHISDRRSEKRNGETGYEMTSPRSPRESRSNHPSAATRSSGTEVPVYNEDSNLQRSGSLGARVGEGLKKRVGSLKRTNRA